MSKLKTTDYEKGDEELIFHLFQESFDSETSLKYWNWRFRDNPTGIQRIKLLWDDTKLVGHYAVSPISLNYFGTTILTALSNMTMTHPKYWGKGIFTTLADLLYTDLKSDTEFVWGFPNENSHYGFIKKLKWEDIYIIPMFSCGFNQIRLKFESSNDGHILNITQFDQKFDDYWQKSISQEDTITVARSSRYLNWRYFMNPVNNYLVKALTKNGEIGGFIVYKIYKNDLGEEELDLVDFQTLSIDDFQSLFISIIKEYEGSRIKRINTWLNPAEKCWLWLEKAGFRPTIPLTYFGTVNIRFEPVAHQKVLFFPNWTIRMADSDVF